MKVTLEERLELQNRLMGKKLVSVNEDIKSDIKKEVKTSTKVLPFWLREGYKNKSSINFPSKLKTLSVTKEEIVENNIEEEEKVDKSINENITQKVKKTKSGKYNIL